MAELTRDGDVFVLNLGDDENRFSPSWVAEVDAALEEVAATDGPRALVTTATGKFFSNGLDLDWLLAHPGELGGYIAAVQELFAKMLALPAPSIAALQGHCFAAGALLALGHDQRFMRIDRGFFCLPEVDIDIPFAPGMSRLVQDKLRPSVALEAMTTGRRYGGEQALEAGIVDRALGEEALLDEAKAAAAELAPKAGATLATIRSTMYREAIELLRSKGGSLSIPGL
jgi:enoyl-CoA hydratase/carnithine racemase